MYASIIVHDPDVGIVVSAVGEVPLGQLAHDGIDLYDVDAHVGPPPTERGRQRQRGPPQNQHRLYTVDDRLEQQATGINVLVGWIASVDELERRGAAILPQRTHDSIVTSNRFGDRHRRIQRLLLMQGAGWSPAAS